MVAREERALDRSLFEEPADFRANPRRPYEVYGFTEEERAIWRITDERFQEIMADELTLVHEIQPSSNQFGEFIFVATSRPGDQGRVAMVFYGLGYHEYRECHILDEWYWYQGSAQPELLRKQVDLQTIVDQLAERKELLVGQALTHEQSERGRLFEMLADLTDEDGALAELQDIEDVSAMFERMTDGVEDVSAQDKEIKSETERTVLFPLGQIVATPGAIDALIKSDASPVDYLQQHQVGDWGELDEEDVEQNNLAIEQGQRLLSAYRLETGVKIWIITEWDRSVTTILLPDEY